MTSNGWRPLVLQLVSMAGPIAGSTALSVLMLLVDTVVCSQLENSSRALTALGFAVQVIFLVMVSLVAVLASAVALVSRAYGANNIGRMNEIIEQATILTAIISMLVTILGIGLAEPILRGLGASDEVAAEGSTYLRLFLLGTPAFFLTRLYTAVLRAIGNTRVPFACALAANLVNAPLTYVLVLGVGKHEGVGVSGAAIATVSAQFLNLALLLFLIRRGVARSLGLKLLPTRFHWDRTLELLRLGWPAACEMLVVNIGFLSLVWMLGRIDETAVAANGIGARVQSLAFIPGMALAQATVSMVGQALGASNVTRARAIARASLSFSAGLHCCIAVILLVTTDDIVSALVGGDRLLASYAVQCLQFACYAMLPYSIDMALTAVLQGSGATRTSLRLNLWTTVGLQVPMSYMLAFAFDMGAYGIWCAYPITLAGKALIVYKAYRTEGWALTGIRAPAA